MGMMIFVVVFVAVVVVVFRGEKPRSLPFPSWGTSQPMAPWRPLLGGCTLASFIDDVASLLNGGHVAATWTFSQSMSLVLLGSWEGVREWVLP